MASLFCLFVVVIALTSCCVSGSYLAREHVSYYRTILAGMGHRSLDKEGIVALMSLFDGNPKYNLAAVEHAAQSLEFPEPSWDALERLIDKIYGDQISDDPYEPQEIHLAITGLTSSMKAMWVTMKGLEDPFVEYIETGGDWSAAKQSAAISYTYTVPQKWWPIFSGMIYEADMNGLEAGKRYDYRVGGFDTANNTVRTSDTFSFNSKPNNDPNRPTTVASLADHGTFELLGFATVDNMVKLQNDLDIDYVFVAGDLSYAGLSTDFPPLNITKEDEVMASCKLKHFQFS